MHSCIARFALAFVCISAVWCEASHINLGSAGSFAILGTDVAVDESVTGPSTVTGDIGVSQGSQFSITGSSSVFGDIIYYDPVTGANFSNSSSGTVPAPFQNAAIVSQAITDALDASGDISAATATQSLASITSSTTITRTGTDNVVRLTGNISLGGGDVLTINGLAGDYFYFDLPTGNFTMSGGSQIVLTGGVTEANVFFNVTSSGGQVAFSNATTTAYGNFLVTQRSVQVNAPTVYGRIFSGGGQISVTSGGDVFIPEPASAALLAFAGVGLLPRRRIGHTSRGR